MTGAALVGDGAGAGVVRRHRAVTDVAPVAVGRRAGGEAGARGRRRHGAGAVEVVDGGLKGSILI